MRSFPGYAVILAVVIGVSIGTVSAVHITNHFEGDVTIDKTMTEDGNLILNDGHLGIGATPNSIQLIRAQSVQGNNAVFLVVGDEGEAIFNLRATTGIPALQITDGDTSQKYRIRLGQSSQALEFVDTSAGPNAIRLKMLPNGDICIGAC